MSPETLAVEVTIEPVSRNDNPGGTVSVRIPLIDENGEPRTAVAIHDAAIDRACVRLYGRGAFWWPDSGLPGYGQVMRPSQHGGADAVTYRARLWVSVPDLPPDHVRAVRDNQQELQRIYDEQQAHYALGLAAGQDGAAKPTNNDPYGEIARGYRDGKHDRASGRLER